MITQAPEYYVEGVLARDRRILSKTITLIESALPFHQVVARDVLNRLLKYSGNAIRLGISGVPGVGKSTFIESLGLMLTDKSHALAVLAVDPSSARTGGSIMADKTRMERLAVRERAFIRPSPSGGTLGGVARKTREAMLVCEAAGFDVIIVETVGVGQSEIAVAAMVDFFLVLMLAGAGDDIQAMKKGILELADTIAINKADGDNTEKAERARQQYQNVMQLLNPAKQVWKPRVMTCSALNNLGVDHIWHTVRQHHELLVAQGELEAKRCAQTLNWTLTLVAEGLKAQFARHADIQKQLPQIAKEVESGNISPAKAADRLLFFLDNQGVV